MSESEEEKMAIADLQSIRKRRRPAHSKRKDSAAKGKMEEEMILKEAAAKMGVNQMASTAYLSESEEEAMMMAQEQSIRFLKEVTDTDLVEIRRRKPPHMARRYSRDSRLLPEMMWYKPQNKFLIDNEELAHEELLLFLETCLKPNEGAVVPSQGLKIPWR